MQPAWEVDVATLGKAIQLDRNRQWGPLIEATAQEEPSIVVCIGHVDEALHHFVDRIQLNLSPRLPGGATVHRVSLHSRGGQQPTSAYEWLRRMGTLLGQDECTLVESVQRCCEESRLVVVFEARLPPPPDRQVRSLLRAFLRDEVPRLLDEARGRHPIHFVLAIEYELFDEPFLSGLGDLHPHIVVLEQLVYPSWIEVQGFLRQHRLPEGIQGAVHEFYEGLEAGGTKNFWLLMQAVQAAFDGMPLPSLPLAKVTSLAAEELEDIGGLAIDLNLGSRRDQLLLGLPATYRANLPRSNYDGDQLRLDLHALNGQPTIAGHPHHPLATWLRNAERLLDLQPEAETFARHAARLRRA